jgi:hypothetical protein
VFLLFLLLLKMALESVLKKTLHTRIFFFFSMTTKVRSQLTYSEDAHFPICFRFAEIAQSAGKREYTYLKE